MAVDSKQISELATLARVRIEDETTLKQELNDILAFVEQIDQADTSGLKPMAHPIDQAQPLRKDEVSETDARDELMANAPSQYQGYFLVPRVID